MDLIYSDKSDILNTQLSSLSENIEFKSKYCQLGLLCIDTGNICRTHLMSTTLEGGY